MPAAVPLAVAGIGAAGNVMSGQAQGRGAEEQAKLGLTGTREQIVEQGRRFNIGQGNTEADRAAYEAAVARANAQGGQGQEQFMEASDTASPELAQLKRDIVAGNTEAATTARGQMNAAMAQQGVRGGQAAANIAQGMGEMGIKGQREINQLIGQEGMQREAEKRAFLAAKARIGQTGSIAGVSK